VIPSVDAEMELQVPGLEPGAASRLEIRRFVDLRKSQQVAIEPPGHVFAARRNRDLHMVNHWPVRGHDQPSSM